MHLGTDPVQIEALFHFVGCKTVKDLTVFAPRFGKPMTPDRGFRNPHTDFLNNRIPTVHRMHVFAKINVLQVQQIQLFR